MTDSFLVVEDLTVTIALRRKEVTIIKDISFTLEKGESLVLVGESGSGKTTLAMAMIGAALLDRQYRVTGRSEFLGKSLLVKREREFAKRMGKEIGVILQDPSLALHPLYTIGEQIEEMFIAHEIADGNEEAMQEKIGEALDRVELHPSTIHRYPHEISGGQKQRALIAIATLFAPKLLICDEPTAALDPTVQNEILRLLLSIKEEGTALFFITHDIKAAKALGDAVMVMHKGDIVEKCTPSEFLHPKHPYTRHLLESRPENFHRKRKNAQ